MQQEKPPGRAEMPRLKGELSLAGVARLAMSWSELLVETDGKRTLAMGKPVSCGKGCAACCRELIPLSPAEAFSVVETLEALPEALRTARGQRFRTAAAALAAGAPTDPDAYFRLRIACPLLEGEVCSAHGARPLACREHLAISPAQNCASFPDHSIQVLPLRHRVGEALSRVCAELLARAPERIPLVLAPEWVRGNRALGRLRWDAEKVAESLAHHVFS